MKTWTRAELRRFLDALAGDHDFALYRLAAQRAMRRGELLGLRWRDLDLDAARLNVRQQWSGQGGRVRFGEPKARNGLRSIDLDRGTVAVLREHWQVQQFERRAWDGEYRSDLDLVFTGLRGRAQGPGCGHQA